MERLLSNKISFQDVLQEINLNGTCSVVIYTSQIDDLGSDDSDFDVYVLCNEPPSQKYNDHFCINTIEFDIEYHYIDIIKKFNNLDLDKFVSPTRLSFYLRILKGDVIYNIDDSIDIRKYINKDRLEQLGVFSFMTLARSDYSDALKMYNLGEHITGIMLARNALNNLIMVVNILNQNYVFKTKWVYCLLYRSFGENHHYTQNYRRFTLHEISDPEKSLENLLTYIHDLIVKVRLHNGIT